jgi:hypothetical protein
MPSQRKLPNPASRTVWNAGAVRPEDRLEYRRWARRVVLFYGVLLIGGTTFAVARDHRPPRHDAASVVAAQPVFTALISHNRR